MEKIIIGSDHAGYELKEHLYRKIMDIFSNIEIIDIGCYASSSCDYPDFAHELAEKVQSEGARGILICGTGQGMCMAANRHSGIRAGVAWNTDIAKAIRNHNNSNVLCLGARNLSLDQAEDIVRVWLGENASKEERHIRRMEKIEF